MTASDVLGGIVERYLAARGVQASYERPAELAERKVLDRLADETKRVGPWDAACALFAEESP